MKRQRKSSLDNQGNAFEAGFALPVAIGVGLIMLLLGVTMVVRSQNDQVNASAQKATAKSLAAAESGISKVQTFLNLHRILATYPDADGSNDWENTCESQIPDADLLGLYPDNNNWPNVDTNDPTTAQPLNGEFRVLEYNYDGTVGQAGGSGTLKVQGRINAGEPGESVAQVEVEIPVQPVSEIVALWVEESITGDLNINGNGVVVGSCDERLEVVDSSDHLIVQPPLSNTLPNLPEEDLSGVPVLPVDPTVILGKDSPNQQYLATELNRSLKVWTSSDVRLWVDGDINLKGQAIQCFQPDGPDDDTALDPCGADDTFRVTIYGRGTLNRLSLDEGSVLCNIFVHAPGYDVETDGDTATATGSDLVSCNDASNKLVGSFWVKSWQHSGAATLTQIPNNPGIPKANLPPKLAPISRWETQQAE